MGIHWIIFHLREIQWLVHNEAVTFHWLPFPPLHFLLWVWKQHSFTIISQSLIAGSRFFFFKISSIISVKCWKNTDIISFKPDLFFRTLPSQFSNTPGKTDEKDEINLGKESKKTNLERGNEHFLEDKNNNPMVCNLISYSLVFNFIS